eukprot:TRINITY_DN12792_c0_g1_i1.p1 TRINITY_DN12792_c0_g1~~TRINITY_DN12792_c0_g1_i1.p1  ORF type:complete len:1273 (-),score=371.66 TRINITY_DN12792_c0_g1_i1:29-3847(-)
MFRLFSSPLQSAIEKATNESLSEPDTALNAEVCALINHGGDAPGNAIKAFKGLLKKESVRGLSLTLALLDSCVKSGIQPFIAKVADHDFSGVLHKLATNKKLAQVTRDQLLGMIDTWKETMTEFEELFNTLKAQGVHFPDRDSTIVRNPLKKPSIAPDPDQFDVKEYEALLDEMDVKPAQRQQLLLLPVAQKKLLLLQRTQSVSSQHVDETPTYFVSKLKAEPNLRNLSALVVFLRTKPKSWVTDFIRLDGLEMLFGVLAQIEPKLTKTATDLDMQAEAIRCFYQIMNKREGVIAVIGTKDACRRLTLNLDSDNIAMKVQLYRILTGICLLDDSASGDGHKLLLEAFDQFKLVKRSPKRFSRIVQDLAAATDAEFQVACLFFIQAMVNKPTLDLKQRADLRKEFEELNLLAVFEQMKKSKNDDLITQVDMYEERQAEDDEHLVQVNPALDIDNYDAVFKAVLSAARQAGTDSNVLKTLHHLLRVPPEKIVETWSQIEEFVGWVVANPNKSYRFSKAMMDNIGLRPVSATTPVAAPTGPVAPIPITTSAPVVPPQPAEVSAAADILANRAVADLSESEMPARPRVSSQPRPVSPPPLISALGDSQVPPQLTMPRRAPPPAPLDAESPPARRGSAPEDPSATTKPDDDAPPVPARPAQTDAGAMPARRGPPPPIDAEGFAAPAARGGPPPPLDGDAPAPVVRRGGPPPPMDGDAPVMPARRGPPPPIDGDAPAVAVRGGPPPLDGDAGAMPARRGPPSPIDGDAGSAPARRGPPPPIDGPDSGAAPARRGPPPPMDGPGPVSRGPPPPMMAAAAPSRPKRPAIKPSTKLKALGWNKVADNKVDNTVWEKTNDEKIDIDKSELEALFAAKEVSTQAKEESAGPAESGERKPGSVRLLSDKRTTNLTITLTLFSKMSYPDVAKSLVQLDQGALTLEQAKGLLKECPTSDEMDLLNSFEEDVNLLNKPERFYLAIGSIPRLQQRLSFEVFRRTFDEKVNDLKETLSSVIAACNEVMESKKFLKMLEIILAIGNYLNGSTFRGGAYGFRIDTLTKLNETKAANPRLTLLNYLADYCEKKYPDILDFSSELSHVPAAAKAPISTIPVDMKEISAPVAELKGELAAVARITEQLEEGDRFLSLMTPFYEQASAVVDSLVKMNNEREELGKKVVAFVGEDKMGADELFGIVATFTTSFEKALVTNKTEREKEERAQKRATEAALRRTASTIRSAPTETPPTRIEKSPVGLPLPAGTGGMMDELMGSLKAGMIGRLRSVNKV